jgi:hypothetical protein
MPPRPLDHLRHNAIAYLALFVALGGTSYAAATLPANSVGSRQLVNHSVTAVKLDGKSIVAHVVLMVRIDGDGHVLYSKPRVTPVGLGTGSPKRFLLNLSRPLGRHCALVATADGINPATVTVARSLTGTTASLSLETTGAEGQPVVVAGLEVLGVCP